MRVLISASSHKRYKEIVREHKMPLDLPKYIPERMDSNREIREELKFLSDESFILIGTFYQEEYVYLANHNCRLFELTELDWSEGHAKKQRL